MGAMIVRYDPSTKVAEDEEETQSETPRKRECDGRTLEVPRRYSPPHARSHTQRFRWSVRESVSGCFAISHRESYRVSSLAHMHPHPRTPHALYTSTRVEDTSRARSHRIVSLKGSSPGGGRRQRRRLLGRGQAIDLEHWRRRWWRWLDIQVSRSKVSRSSNVSWWRVLDQSRRGCG